MNKMTILAAVALTSAGSTALAMDDHKMDMKTDFRQMDTNGDGMISKEEFMKFHEMMFDKMKKNKAGMVDVKDMEAMHQNMEMMHKGKTNEKDAGKTTK